MRQISNVAKKSLRLNYVHVCWLVGWHEQFVWRSLNGLKDKSSSINSIHFFGNLCAKFLAFTHTICRDALNLLAEKKQKLFHRLDGWISVRFTFPPISRHFAKWPEHQLEWNCFRKIKIITQYECTKWTNP